MSLREEREEEHSSPNTGSTGRGLGLAAAAIGVGVGAALYYFFSKRENPDSQGSSSDWQETPFIMNHTDDSDSEFATTTDTSINDTGSDSVFSDDDYADDVPYLDPFEYMSDDDDDLTSEAPSDEYSVADSESDSSLSDVVVVDSASGVPTQGMNCRRYSYFRRFPTFFNRSSQIDKRRNSNTYRSRAMTLEECSICFDVILVNQEEMSLPCTHRFHSACILPWLQEQQTCPNCRKQV